MKTFTRYTKFIHLGLLVFGALMLASCSDDSEEKKPKYIDPFGKADMLPVFTMVNGEPTYTRMDTISMERFVAEIRNIDWSSENRHIIHEDGTCASETTIFNYYKDIVGMEFGIRGFSFGKDSVACYETWEGGPTELDFRGILSYQYDAQRQTIHIEGRHHITLCALRGDNLYVIEHYDPVDEEQEPIYMYSTLYTWRNNYWQRYLSAPQRE